MTVQKTRSYEFHSCLKYEFSGVDRGAERLISYQLTMPHSHKREMVKRDKYNSIVQATDDSAQIICRTLALHLQKSLITAISINYLD